MPRPAPHVDPRLPSRPFDVASALARGVSVDHLRTSAFDTPFRGVRVVQEAPGTMLERCRALATVLDDGVVFGHVTALRLLGVEVPWTLASDHRLHVVTRRPQDRPRRTAEGVVAHWSRQSELRTVEIGGIRATSPEQTFVQVGVGLRIPDDVVVLGDAMMRRRRTLTTTSTLKDAAERTHKVKGIVQVREQVERMRPGTDSSTETRTRLALTDAGLPCPAVNAVVRTSDGRYVKRVDMLYRDLRVAIEYDGDQHRTDRVQWQDDIRRRRWLEELGWDVVVVVLEDLRDPGRLVARIRGAIRARQRGSSL